MNDYDSERIYRLMERAGWERAGGPEHADLIVVNTCSVREKPEHKALSEIGWMRRFRKKNPDLILVMAGCVAQQLGDSLLKKVRDLDIVLGTHSIDKLPLLVKNGVRRSVQTAWDYEGILEFENIAPSPGNPGISWKGMRAGGFVPVMRGCDKKCSYCIVPQVRGREISRPMKDILAEVRFLVDGGVRDVTLLGQIVNRYGRTAAEKTAFPELVDAVSGMEGLLRLRFASSHPTYVTDSLVERFERLPKLASHIHLPVQSGSDRILKSMRRGHTIAQYREKVAKLKAARPDIAVTTDIIVGYPGETEDDFRMTLDLIQEIRFDSLFAFKYSPRPATPALELGDTVSPEEKAARLARVFETAQPLVLEKNRAQVGRVHEVILEGDSKGKSGGMFGRTSCNRIVHFSASGRDVGDLLRVRISEGRQNSLAGAVVTNSENPVIV